MYQQFFDKAVYESTSILDSIRKENYPQLKDHTYLDYTGAGLPSLYQYRKHIMLLQSNVWGNPHTNSPASKRSTAQVELARKMILKYFNASPEEYCVVFTQNATGGLRIIGESYPFTINGKLLMTEDNHNSVLGIRIPATAKQGEIAYVPLNSELRVNELELYKKLASPGSGQNLFIFPAQSNFSGVKHPLEWIKDAQLYGWDVVLDAAAFVPTNKLNLSVYKPEAVCVSFYKMFGYPTGVGCLIAKKEFLLRLTPPTFSGGTILIVAKNWHQVTSDLSARFEYGTINYQAIFAVQIGLSFLENLGMHVINDRVMSLTAWLLDKLPTLFHANGKPLVQIYGPLDLTSRGATIACNLLDTRGNVIPLQYIEESMQEFNISIRTGCFCNPGAGAMALHANHDLPEPEVPFSNISVYAKLAGAKAEGAIRISLGLPSNLYDCRRLITFLKSFRNGTFNQVQIPRTSC